MIPFVLALIFLVPTVTSAQRTAVLTSVRHANTVKTVQSLDWVGLYDQLEPYPRWWKETGACASIPLPPGRQDSVQFYFVNAIDFAPTPTDKPDRMMAGVTYAAAEQIVIAVLLLRDERVVKHEMLHQILYWWGEPNWHNDKHEAFKQCGLQTPVDGDRGKRRQSARAIR